MNKLTLSQLEQYLSKAAWILKGPVDASDFKVYILFFKIRWFSWVGSLSEGSLTELLVTQVPGGQKKAPTQHSR